jgi:hypothetical protein
MCYVESVEEQKYLAGMRKEKQAFERLIREKGVRTGSPPLEPPVAGHDLTYALLSCTLEHDHPALGRPAWRSIRADKQGRHARAGH